MTLNRTVKENDSLELRKQALMVGMSPFLSPEQCVKAVSIWQQHYSHAPRFALQEFIRHLIPENSPLWPYRNELFLNVTRVMALPAREITERFASAFEQDIDLSAPVTRDGSEAAQKVFEQMFQGLLRRVETDDYPVAVQLRKFLREKMLQGETFNMQTQRLNSWILGLKQELDVSLTLERMRRIVHLAYLGSCEYLGPVRADQLLSETVEEVEKKTRGKEFSPRDLL